MRESLNHFNRKLRSPETGGGSGNPDDPKPEKITVDEWKKRLKESGASDVLPVPKGKKEKEAVAGQIGEQAVASVFNQYRSSKDNIGFERAVMAYAQARARGVPERNAMLAGRLFLNEADIDAFTGVLPVVETRIRSIGVPEFVEPKPVEKEPPKRAEPKEPKAPESVVAPVETQVPLVGSSGPAPYQGLSLRQYPPPPTPDKKLKHGEADGDLLDEKGPADEERDLIEAASGWRGSRERQRLKGQNERQEQKLDRLAREFDRRAEADGANPNTILGEMRAKLSPAEIERFLSKIETLGWKMNGEVHQEDAEEPKAEPQYIELAGFKNDKDMEKEFGKPAGRADNIPFWILNDGDAAIIPVIGQGARRVGKDGYLKLNSGWFEFRDGKFSPITAEEEQRRRAAIEFRPMTPEERRRLQEGTRPAQNLDPYAPQQLAEDEGKAAPVDSPEAYGNVDTVLGEVGPERPRRSLADARKDFIRLYTGNNTLAQAYHESVRDLYAEDREEFDEELYSGHPGLESELTTVINEELRTNPPYKEAPAIGNLEGVSKAYSVFRKEYKRQDRGTLVHAYRDAVRDLIRSEQDEFDDGLERIVDVPSDILAAMINDERKNNPPKERREPPQDRQNQNQQNRRNNAPQNRQQRNQPRQGAGGRRRNQR